jgi:hypothetical protein
MNTERGRVKDKILRRDPRISLCVTDGLRYVTITGKAQLNDDLNVARADLAHLAVRYGWPVGGEIETFMQQQRVTIRFPIEHVVEHGFADD